MIRRSSEVRKQRIRQYNPCVRPAELRNQRTRTIVNLLSRGSADRISAECSSSALLLAPLQPHEGLAPECNTWLVSGWREGGGWRGAMPRHTPVLRHNPRLCGGDRAGRERPVSMESVQKMMSRVSPCSARGSERSLLPPPSSSSSSSSSSGEPVSPRESSRFPPLLLLLLLLLLGV